MASILVVDDDPTARELLCTVLGYAGHSLRQAYDGAHGLEQVQEECPDLVIVDLLMPAIDGLQFVRRLREVPETSTTPVIFYTASYLESEARQLARACGVSYIIIKPAEPEQILQQVNTVLGEERMPQAATAPEDDQHAHLMRLTARLSQKASQVIPRLEAMIDLGLRLASERDPEKLLSDFCESSRRIIGARRAIVGVRSKRNGVVRYQFTSNATGAAAIQVSSSVWESEVHRTVLEARQPARLGAGDTMEDTGIAHAGIRSFLSVPVQSPQRAYGWLSLADRIGADAFSEEDEVLAQILAAQVGRIYENGSLYAEIKRYAEELEREISERMAAQEEIRLLNLDLERRIEERTAQLKDANAELEAFGYTVSHDLRTPLRTISGYASLLLDSEADRLSEAGRRYLHASIEGAHRLSRLIDDLLSFSRLGREALQIDDVDMNALVREVWAELTGQDSGAAVNKQMEELPPAKGDAQMLREVWRNLVSNALKYTSKKTDRQVRIGSRSGESDIVYYIADNGVGFDMAEAGKLFGVFQRLHSRRDFEGTGAGLAIVDRIVRRHGGSVWAEAGKDKGATFSFSLPRESRVR